MSNATESTPSEPAWLLVGDFLFYLRLLARQFASVAREAGEPRKAMTIVPDFATAWDQLAARECEALILDAAQPGPETLEFVRALRAQRPEVRLILVSAALDLESEASLMEAGVHLCFNKPRTPDEAASMYQLVSAIVRSDGFCPNGVFRGLAPARFIQFLCARGESGRMVFDTPRGEAEMVIDQGRIVDARVGELHGDEAAAVILSLDRTERCHFKQMYSSQFHTVRLDTHQLWRDAGKIASPSSATPQKIQPPKPLAKGLRETFESLAAMERVAVVFELDQTPA